MSSKGPEVSARLRRRLPDAPDEDLADAADVGGVGELVAGRREDADDSSRPRESVSWVEPAAAPRARGAARVRAARLRRGRFADRRARTSRGVARRRCSGSFSRQRCSRRRTPACVVRGRRFQSGSSWRIAAKQSATVSPVEDAPPREHLVERRSRTTRGRCAGRRPARAPAPGSCRPACRGSCRPRSRDVGEVGEGRGRAVPASTAFARPKSRPWPGPSGVTVTLAGLQVPMDDALLVRRGERVGDLAARSSASRIGSGPRPASRRATRPRRARAPGNRTPSRSSSPWICRDVRMVERGQHAAPPARSAPGARGPAPGRRR